VYKKTYFLVSNNRNKEGGQLTSWDDIPSLKLTINYVMEEELWEKRLMVFDWLGC